MFNFHHVGNTAILYTAGLLQHSVFPPYMQKGLKHVYALCWPGNIILVTEAELLAAVCIPKLLYHWNSHLILKHLSIQLLCPLRRASLVVLKRTLLFFWILSFNSLSHTAFKPIHTQGVKTRTNTGQRRKIRFVFHQRNL